MDPVTARYSKTGAASWRWKRNEFARKRKRRDLHIDKSTIEKYRKLISSHLLEFCEDTSLHGIHYITQNRRQFIERILWLAVCLFCAIIAISMMMLIYERYQISPTVTTVETTNYPIWNLPFPAVTICNNNQVYLKEALKLASELSVEYNIDKEIILDYMKLLTKLIRPKDIKGKDLNVVQQVEPILEKAKINITTLMVRLAHPCETLLKKCLWLNIERNCSELFNISRTFYGICCSFNYHGVKPELTFSPSAPDIIQYVAGAGRRAGLWIYMNIDQPNYFAPIFPNYGISVLIHDPISYPETSVRIIPVEPNQLFSAILDAQAVESSSDVRMISINQRQCWFEDEAISVESDVEYNFKNCITECRMKVIREECGCTPFYYPPFNKSSRECRVSDSSCLRNLSNVIAGVSPENNIPEFSSDSEENLEQIGMKCSCLPSCSDKSYFVQEQSSTIYKELTVPGSILRSSDNLSLMYVYFRDFTCIKYCRNVYMTWDSMFATFGGVFGLCMGGSVISLFEIIYRLILLIFATLRAIICKTPSEQNKPKAIVPWDIKPKSPQFHLSTVIPTKSVWNNNIMY